MLKKRSRTTSKQTLMADCSSSLSPTEKFRRPISSILSSPRLFTNFASKGFTDTESILSPTSILDTKPFSALRKPFCSYPNPPKSPKPENRIHWENLDSRGVGLGILDEKLDTKLSKPENRRVHFGSKLKIQIPPLPPSVLSPPRSPDFGTKTKKSQFGSSGNSGSPENQNSPQVFASCLSASEMELSEDYTRVITHGPNPRTTHIFDNCIVESCCGVFGISSLRNGNGFCGNGSIGYPSESFLSFCYTCKKNLGQGKDIYMYRGEKAFCSRECRHEVMMLEEEMGESEPDDVYGACL